MLIITVCVCVRERGFSHRAYGEAKEQQSCIFHSFFIPLNGFKGFNNLRLLGF